MVVILALLMGMSLTAWTAYLVFARAKRQLDAAMAYRGVARSLGLDLDTRGVSLQGHLGDRRLWIGQVMVGYGPNRRMALWGVVDLRRPLGLGLQVRRRGLSERVFRRNRSPGIELGHAIDRRVEVLGDDKAAVRTLLGADSVRDSLSRLMDVHPDIVVTDSSVRVHLDRPLTSELKLHNLVDRMLALADALEQSRMEVCPPGRLSRVAEDWSKIASARGLTFEGWLPALVGAVEGSRIVVTVSRSEGDYTGDLRIYFGFHKPLGLRLYPQIEPDGYWSVGQDIDLGEQKFDQLFVVKGWDPGKIRELLDEPARTALIEALQCGRLQVEDTRLHLSGLALDSATINRAIERSLAVAQTLRWTGP